MAEVDLEIVGKTLKMVTCPHDLWSEDEECKCGSSLSHCLECYATLQDLEDQAQRVKVSNLQGEIESWKLATGLIDSAGDPDGITPEHLEARITALEAWQVVAMEWKTWYQSGCQGMIPYDSVKAAEALDKVAQA